VPDFGNIQIPVGPQHPALKEPESFLITLRGEKITAASVRMGYNHRGVEKGAEGRNYTQDIYLIERICGICSHAHATAFIGAVEEIAGLELPRRAKYIRMLVGELERVHSHLLWLGVAGHEIGFDTLLMYSWRDREIVMDLLAAITGNRVHYSMNTLGGVRRDVDAAMAESILRGVDRLEAQTKYYIRICTEETTLIRRLSGVGVVTHEDALRLHVVGPTARASSVNRDVRKDDPYLAYDELDFKVVTSDHCDVYGRALVRLGELMESYSLIRQILAKMPEGPITVKAPRKVPAGEALSRYEAPRGEDVHYVKANGSEKPERVKVRAPTLANLQAVSHMLRDNNLADMPIVIAAIDPCFSCTDRSVELNRTESGRRDRMDWGRLRTHGIEFHRGLGIDFTELNRQLSQRMKTG
jgi:membrane-bound hydrogenase subunit alpha